MPNHKQIKLLKALTSGGLTVADNKQVTGATTDFQNILNRICREGAVHLRKTSSGYQIYDRDHVIMNLTLDSRSATTGLESYSADFPD